MKNGEILGKKGNYQQFYVDFEKVNSTAKYSPKNL
jgi:hypothetical protein